MRRCFGSVFLGPYAWKATCFPKFPALSCCDISCFRSYGEGFVGSLEFGDLGGAIGATASLTLALGRTPDYAGCPSPWASRRFWSSLLAPVAQGATVFPLSMSLFLAECVLPGGEFWPSSSCHLSSQVLVLPLNSEMTCFKCLLPGWCKQGAGSVVSFPEETEEHKQSSVPC